MKFKKTQRVCILLSASNSLQRRPSYAKTTSTNSSTTRNMRIKIKFTRLHLTECQQLPAAGTIFTDLTLPNQPTWNLEKP